MQSVDQDPQVIIEKREAAMPIDRASQLLVGLANHGAFIFPAEANVNHQISSLLSNGYITVDRTNFLKSRREELKTTIHSPYSPEIHPENVGNAPFIITVTYAHHSFTPNLFQRDLVIAVKPDNVVTYCYDKVLNTDSKQRGEFVRLESWTPVRALLHTRPRDKWATSALVQLWNNNKNINDYYKFSLGYSVQGLSLMDLLEILDTDPADEKVVAQFTVVNSNELAKPNPVVVVSDESTDVVLFDTNNRYNGIDRNSPETLRDAVHDAMNISGRGGSAVMEFVAVDK